MKVLLAKGSLTRSRPAVCPFDPEREQTFPQMPL